MSCKFVTVADIFSLIVEFLALKDLGNLDTAISDYHIRESFLRTMQSITLVGDENKDLGISFLRWLKLRSTCIKFLRIANMDRSTELYLAPLGQRLQQLNLTGCLGLTDMAFKSVLLRCRNLKVLNLQETNVNAASMKHLKYCTQLSKLSLAGCFDIATSGLFHIEKCPSQLQDLNFALNLKITDNVLVRLSSRFVHIVNLILVGCIHLTDIGIESIAVNCPRLKYLSMSYCPRITDTGIIKIAEGCIELREIELADCDFLTDRGVIKIAESCPQLVTIDLSDIHGITDASLVALGLHCRSLMNVYVARNGVISSEGVRELVLCRNLAEMDLSGNRNVNDDAIQSLSQYSSKLRFLDISRCASITDASLRNLAEGCIFLEVLYMPFLVTIHDCSVTRLAIRCKNLKKLDLMFCSNISDESALSIAENCVNLTEINLSYCFYITDIGLRAIFSHCRLLDTVEIKSNDVITDLSLKDLAQYCRNLRRLNVSLCQKITNSGIGRVLENCRELGCLCVAKCYKLNDGFLRKCIVDSNLIELNLSHLSITDESIKILSRRCKRLQSINLAHCHGISYEGFDGLITSCPDLHDVYRMDGLHLHHHNNNLAVA